MRCRPFQTLYGRGGKAFHCNKGSFCRLYISESAEQYGAMSGMAGQTSEAHHVYGSKVEQSRTKPNNVYRLNRAAVIVNHDSLMTITLCMSRAAKEHCMLLLLPLERNNCCFIMYGNQSISAAASLASSSPAPSSSTASAATPTPGFCNHRAETLQQHYSPSDMNDLDSCQCKSLLFCCHRIYLP